MERKGDTWLWNEEVKETILRRICTRLCVGIVIE